MLSWSLGGRGDWAASQRRRGLRSWLPAEMQRNGVVECSVCRSRVVVPSPRSVSRAYDKHRSKMSSKFRALNVFLVVGDCILVGLQVCARLNASFSVPSAGDLCTISVWVKWPHGFGTVVMLLLVLMPRMLDMALCCSVTFTWIANDWPWGVMLMFDLVYAAHPSVHVKGWWEVSVQSRQC